ncbi:helix-turn-helix domain-containing protein [Pseudovibrio denitrificans]|uniref:helix-turn-helix domain-containing protein n=1 Tax=Pseudovibrio denitrificans TaxID=258256 RepID=UPI0039BF2349
MPRPVNRPRLSFIPAGVFEDRRLKPRDIQVLGVLCCSTDGNGVTYRSQVKIARQLEVARSTVQKSIGNLVKAGWLKVMAGIRPDGGSCSHTYRVMRALKEEEEEQGDLIEDIPHTAHVNELKALRENRQALPPQIGTYKNESLKPKEEEDKAAASRSLCENASPLSKAPTIADRAGQRFVEGCSRFLQSLGLDPTTAQVRGGLNPVWGWLIHGCDLEKDVKPTIAHVLGRAPEQPRSLNYFTRAILAAKRSREELGKIEGRFIPDGSKAKAARARDLDRSAERCRAAITKVFGEGYV